MVRSMIRSILAAGMLAGLFPAAALPQPPAPPTSRLGQRIVEIRLVREGRPVDEPTVLALVETHVGDPLSMAEVRASITHIFGLGRFQDVQVEAIDAPGGVALRYNLIPLHSVERVDFRVQHRR